MNNPISGVFFLEIEVKNRQINLSLLGVREILIYGQISTRSIWTAIFKRVHDFLAVIVEATSLIFFKTMDHEFRGEYQIKLEMLGLRPDKA